MIPDDTLRGRLATSLGVQRYVDEVAAGGPYRDLDALLAAADAAASTLTPAEIDEALSHHPRIGERATGISRSEQASADADDPELVDAMARGNVAYEERFGRIFLIRAAGRSRREILAELDRRLVLDDDAERAEVAQQLREIAGLRLRTLAQGDA